MFLGNLSSANELKARKNSGKKKKTKNEGTADNVGVNDNFASVSMRRMEADGHITYTQENNSIPREVLLSYLRNCSEMILIDENLREIIRDSEEKRVGLHMSAIEFQRDILEFNYGIERNFGVRYLSALPMRHGDDGELLDAAKNFMYAAMQSYVEGLKLRKRLRGDTLRSAGLPMTRMDIMEFLEGCNALMAMNETKAELKKIFLQTGMPPNERIVAMQREVLTWIGLDADFGVSCLNRMSEDFPNDKELAMKMQAFAACAQLSCQEATFTEKEKTEFYATIPPMMHHFPYMYVISERLRQQQIYEQQMRQNQSGKAANPAMDNRATELESLKKSGILNLLSVPEGRVKIQELAMRIQANKSKADQQVAGWSYEEKLNYFNSFADNHPVMEMLNDASNDPMQKIATFITMSDDDLEQMLKLQYIVAHEDGQSLIDGLRKRLLNNDDVNTETQKGSIVDGIITTIKSLSSMKVSNAGGQSTNQSHSHDHQHGHDHKHSASCGHRVNQPPPDVSKGEIEKIER